MSAFVNSLDDITSQVSPLPSPTFSYVSSYHTAVAAPTPTKFLKALSVPTFLDSAYTPHPPKFHDSPTPSSGYPTKVATPPSAPTTDELIKKVVVELSDLNKRRSSLYTDLDSLIHKCEDELKCRMEEARDLFVQSHAQYKLAQEQHQQLREITGLAEAKGIKPDVPKTIPVPSELTAARTTAVATLSRAAATRTSNMTSPTPTSPTLVSPTSAAPTSNAANTVSRPGKIANPANPVTLVGPSKGQASTGKPTTTPPKKTRTRRGKKKADVEGKGRNNAVVNGAGKGKGKEAVTRGTSVTNKAAGPSTSAASSITPKSVTQRPIGVLNKPSTSISTAYNAPRQASASTSAPKQSTTAPKKWKAKGKNKVPGTNTNSNAHQKTQPSSSTKSILSSSMARPNMGAGAKKDANKNATAAANANANAKSSTVKFQPAFTPRLATGKPINSNSASRYTGLGSNGVQASTSKGPLGSTLGAASNAKATVKAGTNFGKVTPKAAIKVNGAASKA